MDLDFLYRLQEARNPVMNAIMNVFSFFASEYAVLIVICLFYWCYEKRLAYKICLTFLFSATAVHGLKIILKVPRPFVRDPERLFVDKIAKADATGYSFPSGHTNSATSLYAPIALHTKKKWLSVLMYVLIALVMFSRMYLGCHTPQDVIVSFVISFAVAIAIDRLMEKTELDDKKCLYLALTGLAITIAVLIYEFITKTPENLPNILDVFKMSGLVIGFTVGWFIEATRIKYDSSKDRRVLTVILKMLAGAAVALVLQQGLKILFSHILNADPLDEIMIPVHIVRYLLVGLWVPAGYPAILKKIGK